MNPSQDLCNRAGGNQHHKGIAHELPNLQGVDPGWLPPEEVRDEMGIQSQLDQNNRELLEYLEGTHADVSVN